MEAEPCFLARAYGFIGDIKKIYSKNNFARAFSTQVYTMSCLALLLFAAPPFNFIKSKDSRGSLKSCLSPVLPPPPTFYVFNLSLDLQLLFFIHLMLSFFSFFFFFPFSHSSLENLPFLFPCFFCEYRQPCNCGLCEERDETRACIGRHCASVPTYSHSPSRVFVPAPLWSAS